MSRPPVTPTANLSNGGERIVLVGPLGQPLQDFTYSDSGVVARRGRRRRPVAGDHQPAGRSVQPSQLAGELPASTARRGPRGVTTGDFDGDQDVDGADFLAWQRGLGTAAPQGRADAWRRRWRPRRRRRGPALVGGPFSGRRRPFAAGGVGGVQAVGSAVDRHWRRMSGSCRPKRSRCEAVAAGRPGREAAMSALRPARYRRMEVAAGGAAMADVIGPGIADSRDAGGHRGIRRGVLARYWRRSSMAGWPKGRAGVRPQSRVRFDSNAQSRLKAIWRRPLRVGLFSGQSPSFRTASPVPGGPLRRGEMHSGNRRRRAREIVELRAARAAARDGRRHQRVPRRQHQRPPGPGRRPLRLDRAEEHRRRRRSTSPAGISRTTTRTSTSGRCRRSSIPAGGYLLVFASGKDRAVAGQELHTNFSLEQMGEYLALVMPDGTTVADSFAPFPAQVANISYGSRLRRDGD